MALVRPEPAAAPWGRRDSLYANEVDLVGLGLVAHPLGFIDLGYEASSLGWTVKASYDHADPFDRSTLIALLLDRPTNARPRS